MDALKLLTQDHRGLERLFKTYERTGAGTSNQKERLAAQIILELSTHASIEEQFLYPTARELSKSFDAHVLQALEEHHLAAVTLAELAKTPTRDERFDAKMAVLMENVRHHVEEEEGDLFPELRRLMDRSQLALLGEAMEQAKASDSLPQDSSPQSVYSDAVAKILESGTGLVLGTTLAAMRVVSPLNSAHSSR
ncbi:MAG TPA: hemerythrin domain-containing protein [Myxococcaceae bacterium]|nr:hemerythrin domain-containing protein [Myxococcaceae bacterium]